MRIISGWYSNTKMWMESIFYAHILYIGISLFSFPSLVFKFYFFFHSCIQNSIYSWVKVMNIFGYLLWNTVKQGMLFPLPEAFYLVFFLTYFKWMYWTLIGVNTKACLCHRNSQRHDRTHLQVAVKTLENHILFSQYNVPPGISDP